MRNAMGAVINEEGSIGPLTEIPPHLFDDQTFKHQRIGKEHLVEVKAIQLWFGISRRAAFDLLARLKIPLIYMARDAYFNETTFEATMHLLSAPGGTGFAAPGSSYKVSAKKHKIPAPSTDLTDEDIQRMRRATSNVR
jgi:hypothetical protein